MSSGPQSGDQRNPEEIDLVITPTDVSDQYYIQLVCKIAGKAPSNAVPFRVPPELLDRRGCYLTHAEYGKRLSAAVFDSNVEINNTMQRALGARKALASQALRLRISCDDDRIQSLHWETLQLNGAPLFMDGVALSRYISPSPQATSLQGLGQRSSSRSALRALIFIANPQGIENLEDSDSPPDTDAPKLAPILIDQECELAKKLLQSNEKDGGIRIDTEFLGSPGNGTLEALRLKLSEGEGFDLLYLLCHGSFDSKGPHLYLENKRKGGPVQPCKPEDLVTGLANPPRLVVLASCESAGTGNAVANGKIPFWSQAALGPQLARAGVRAVIAMQGKILISTARHFVRGFFSDLCKHGRVDRALAVARANMPVLCPHDYWMPVLFSSESDPLFEPCPPPPPPARVNNSPRLPPGFVDRPGLKADIVTALSGGTNTVLLGAGGFGKTTLTIAACQSEEVTAAFPDGVLWASLGTAPDLVQILTDLYVVAQGVRPEVAGQAQLVKALAKALDKRSWLLTLDDVWRAEDLEPFLQLGTRAVLVSTRKQNLLQEAGQEDWREVQVGEISGEEAAAFLTRGLGLEGPTPEVYQQLSEQLGGWPLLLDLVNARLREERKNRPDFLAYVTRLFEKKGVLGFDRRDTDKRTLAVALSVDVGLDRAEQMYRGLAGKAAEISIFPENIPIPFRVLQELWALDEFDLEEEVLRPLANLSLVRWDKNAGEIRVHMMIDRALKERLNRADGGPAAVHRGLIEAWGEPTRLPHDYAWRWFGWHCAQSGEAARLKSLLLDLKWLQAKLDATDTNALIGDFDWLAGDDPELGLLRNAVQLSAHVLAQDKAQLAGQLLGRIPESWETLRERLLKDAVSQNRTWLRPLRPSLTAPGGPLVRTLDGHSGIVTGVALTADGKMAVSTSWDGTLKVWDLQNGAELLTLEHTYFGASGVAVASDGKRAVSAYPDGTLKVWDLETNAELRILEVHDREVNGVAITLDSRRAVSASSDNTLKVWNLDTGDELHTLKGHCNDVNGAAVTSDGRRAVSASSDNTLKVWDLDTGKELLTLRGHTDKVNGVAVTADSGRAVSASSDHTVKIWDLNTGKELLTLGGHSHNVTGVAVTADGKRAVSASNDNTLKVWDLERGVELRTLTGHSDRVTTVALTEDGNRAVSASADNTLKVWELQAGDDLGTLADHGEPVIGVAFALQGIVAVSISLGWLKVWDPETGNELRTLQGLFGFEGAVAVTTDGKRAVSTSLYAANADGEGAISMSLDAETVQVWDLERGVEMGTLNGHAGRITAVAVTVDGKRAVSASSDKTLKVWDLERGVELGTLRGHSEGVMSLAVTPDGKRAVSASRDKTVKFWDLERSVELWTLYDYSAGVRSLAVTPDGKRAVSASLDVKMQVWDLETGEELRTVTGHSGYGCGVAVAPGGKRAVFGFMNKTLEVWELETGALLASFTCDGIPSHFAFAGDDEVVAGDALGTVHFLRLEESQPGIPRA